MDQPDKPGVCFTCGFLCRRDTLNKHLVDCREITWEDRNAGRWYPGLMEHHWAPWCFRDVPILNEIQELSGVETPVAEPMQRRWAEQQKQREAADRVITKDRHCA